MNKKLPISTDYIQQADMKSQIRFSVFGRKSTVRTFMGLVSEYPSRCYAFPILMQNAGNFKGGPAELRLVIFISQIL
jgi:hypothetical protein